jgi:hypothetical protein
LRRVVKITKNFDQTTTTRRHFDILEILFHQLNISNQNQETVYRRAYIAETLRSFTIFSEIPASANIAEIEWAFKIFITNYFERYWILFILTYCFPKVVSMTSALWNWFYPSPSKSSLNLPNTKSELKIFILSSELNYSPVLKCVFSI